MGILDGPLAGVSKTLLNTFGKSITYVRITEGVYDTATMKKVPAATANENVKGQIGSFAANEVRGTIAAADIKVLIARTDAGLTAAPKLKDKLIIDAVTYEIVAVTPTYTGDEIALFELAVRR